MHLSIRNVIAGLYIKGINMMMEKLH